MSGTTQIIYPDGGMKAERWEASKTPPIQKLWEYIGGYVQAVKVRWGGVIRTAYVDEEGLIKNLPFNRNATDICINPHQIVGPMAIWIPDKKGDKHASKQGV